VIRKMAADGLQIILTTHSPAFLDVLGLEGVALVRKIEGATVARQLTASGLAEFCLEHGADPDRTDADTILPFYANSATSPILAGLFARKVVLVEGMTESMVLPVYLMQAKLDAVKRGIAIIPVMGKGNIAKWWRFFTAYGLSVYVIFDNDPKDDKSADKRRDFLVTIGMREKDIGGLIDVEGLLVGETYAIFGTDFETTLRAELAGYEELEAEAREELGGESKPLIAKYVADRIEIDFDSDGGGRLKDLAKAIRGLPAPA